MVMTTSKAVVGCHIAYLRGGVLGLVRHIRTLDVQHSICFWSELRAEFCRIDDPLLDLLTRSALYACWLEGSDLDGLGISETLYCDSGYSYYL